MLIFWFSGVQVLIFLSGLQKVDNSLYEASMVDGASAWQRFWKITIPVVKPFILLIAVYTVVDIALSSLSPFTKVIQDGMFAPSKGFGFSSAASWLYFLFVLAALLLAFLVFGRKEKDPMRQKDKERRRAARRAEKRAPPSPKGGSGRVMLRRPARRLSPNERNDQHHDKTVCLPPCVKVGDEAAHRRDRAAKSQYSPRCSFTCCSPA